MFERIPYSERDAISGRLSEKKRQVGPSGPSEALKYNRESAWRPVFFKLRKEGV